MSGKTYDPRKVKVLWGGVELTGFGPDSMIEIDRDEASFTKKAGVDGEVTRTRNNVSTGKVKITLMQSSSSNDILSAALALDESTGAGVLPLLITDLSGRTVDFVPDAWIEKPPTQKFGKEIDTREWSIDCGSFTPFVGGNS